MKPHETSLTPTGDVNRRKFMSGLAKTVGTAVLLGTPVVKASGNAAAHASWNVGQIIDLFISHVPGAPFPQTVDTLKSGSRDTKVTGIVTSMFATLEVINRTIALGANFIIAHEPTFYNHLDDTSWLGDDPVYRHKVELLKQHNIAVWRNHDYIHRLTSDGVKAGVVRQLGWGSYSGGDDADVFEIPPTTLKQLISHVKTKLGIPTVRYMGRLEEPVKKILLLPGASGGRRQISAIGKEQPDVVICGEISEWETAEYVRDARAKGQKIALVVAGHIASEEPGSAFLADWLTERVSGVRTTHVPAGNALMFL